MHKGLKQYNLPMVVTWQCCGSKSDFADAKTIVKPHHPASASEMWMSTDIGFYRAAYMQGGLRDGKRVRPSVFPSDA